MALHYTDFVTFDLGETRTYSQRRACYIPADGEDHPRLLTTLHVGLGRKRIDNTYAVEEQPSVGFIGRCFLLVSLTNDGQEQPYEVRIPAKGIPLCTCKAAKCKVAPCDNSEGCRHRDAMAAVIQQGII